MDDSGAARPAALAAGPDRHVDGVADRPVGLPYLVKQLELVLRGSIERALRPLDVTAPQYNALVGLRLRPGMSSAELARHNHVSAQAANELVASLERKGFVERRTAAHNRRVLRMYLTERGTSVLAACEAQVAEIGNRMVAPLSAAQQDALRDAIGSCIAAMTAPPH